jgi:hypothetical protein
MEFEVSDKYLGFLLALLSMVGLGVSNFYINAALMLSGQ